MKIGQQFHIIVVVKGKAFVIEGRFLVERVRALELKKYHEIVMRIPLFEVDLGQAVYHGSYFHLFEIARDSFFRSLDFPYSQLMREGYHLTIAQLACAYFHPLRYDQLIQIRTSVKELKNRTLTMIQQIWYESTIYTQAEFIMVCVDFQGKVSLIPEKLRQVLSEWMAHS
ncbi:MAG TPA: acyl-CoA thioesterase [Thermodesulforhabdus norvegica]|uniref:Acyl-CoA thioesterase n=1 Tax=Thermodesulforhabdus norvegica TaxID=39841 RepID=A0A7C0WVF1_9BACT|nr:acyl-CoA thioesterase [Thermodesulforhabdus norvegica]